MKAFYLLLLCAATGLTPSAFSQAVPKETANYPRIEKLLREMTLEEKLQLIRGATEPDATNQGQAGYLSGIPRLGIPSLRLADGPPGVLTRVPSQAEPATMAVAATFSVKDAHDNGVVIGRDARSLGIDVVLQPFINMDRDLEFARGYNTFGEDPLLTGLIGAAEIRGIQEQDVMAQAKHYVGYDSDSFSTVIDEQTLQEVYIAPFRMAVEAGVSSIMCSYNHLNGPFSCGNKETLLGVLKGELGFKGFLTSDWGATHSATFLNQGLDVEMPGLVPAFSDMHTFFLTKPLPKATPKTASTKFENNGSIPEEPPAIAHKAGGLPNDYDDTLLGSLIANGQLSENTVTEAARRVLYEMDRFGYLDGKQKHNISAQDIEANAAVIEKTAEDAAVLLKNEDNILPLKESALHSVAMIGPTAGQVDAIGLFGERSPGLVERQVGPVAAMKKLVPSAQIEFSVADDRTGSPIPAVALTHDGKPGLLRDSGGTTVDKTLDFSLANGNALPANTNAIWSGVLTVSKAGTYWIYLQDLGGRAELFLDGKGIAHTGAMKGSVHGDIQHASQDDGLPTTDGLDNVRSAVSLTAGPHRIKVVFSPDGSDRPAQIRLNWMTPEARSAAHDAAINAARRAKVAVVFAWTRGKPVFGLPGDQDRLIDEIASVNPNTVVVLNTSQPVAMPWASKVKGILEMWWPGDEGGWSTAKLLLGTANPAGHLPVTWATRLQDYAAETPGHPERTSDGVNGKTTYSEGVLIGYRWFDAQKIAPLFPFGFGLSYTHFTYSDVHAVAESDGAATVYVKVTNDGGMAGDDVPQVYLDSPTIKPAGVQFAPRVLAGFTHVSLAPGQSTVAAIHIEPRSFEYWSTNEQQWKRPEGMRVFHIGSNSRDLATVCTLHP